MKLYPTKQDLMFRKKQIIGAAVAVVVIGIVWFIDEI